MSPKVIWGKNIFHDGQVRMGRAVWDGDHVHFEYFSRQDAMGSEIWLTIIGPTPSEFVMDVGAALAWLLESDSSSRGCMEGREHYKAVEKEGVCRKCASAHELGIEKAFEVLRSKVHYEPGDKQVVMLKCPGRCGKMIRADHGHACEKG